MKTRVFLLITLALAVPLAAMADTETFASTGGSLSGNDKGMTLTGAVLTDVSLPGGGLITGADLGSLTITTGILGNANVTDGGNILAGGSITVTGNGADGVPNGTLFTGTFQASNWTLTTLPDGTHQYSYIAGVNGTDGNGDTATGQMTFNFNTGSAFFEGIATSGQSSSTSTVLAVPEPGEMSLLGVGMLGLLGAIRRKMKA